MAYRSRNVSRNGGRGGAADHAQSIVIVVYTTGEVSPREAGRRPCTVHLTPTRARTDDRGMLRELPDDLMSKMDYRTAYGEAARLAEMARFDHGWGKDFAAGVGGEFDAIEQEVMRRIGHEIHPELIKLAVQDAVEQRKPRW